MALIKLKDAIGCGIVRPSQYRSLLVVADQKSADGTHRILTLSDGSKISNIEATLFEAYFYPINPTLPF